MQSGLGVLDFEAVRRTQAAVSAAREALDAGKHPRGAGGVCPAY